MNPLFPPQLGISLSAAETSAAFFTLERVADPFLSPPFLAAGTYSFWRLDRVDAIHVSLRAVRSHFRMGNLRVLVQSIFSTSECFRAA